MIWCLLSGQSLILWAETQGGPLFARSESAGFPGFPPPRADCRGCWLYILIPLSPFLHPLLPPVSCLRPAGPAAMPPRRHFRPPRPCRIGQSRPGNERCCSGREWCWWRLSGEDLEKKKMLWTRQELEGMIICGQILKYRELLLLLLCVAKVIFYYKPSVQKQKKKKNNSKTKEKTLKPLSVGEVSGERLSCTAIKKSDLTTFCLRSGWQKLYIPSYLNFLYTHECNGRCYFWRRRGHPGWPWQSKILSRALFTLCWWRFCTAMTLWSCSNPTTATVTKVFFIGKIQSQGQSVRDPSQLFERNTVYCLLSLWNNRGRIGSVLGRLLKALQQHTSRPNW